MKDLEVMMQNVINSSFETVTNVQHGAEVLRSFVHLSSREVIIIQKCNLFLQRDVLKG